MEEIAQAKETMPEQKKQAVMEQLPIYEKELLPVLFEVFRDTKDISSAMLEEYERMYRTMTCDGNLGKKIDEAQAGRGVATMIYLKQSNSCDIINTSRGVILSNRDGGFEIMATVSFILGGMAFEYDEDKNQKKH